MGVTRLFIVLTFGQVSRRSQLSQRIALAPVRKAFCVSSLDSVADSFLLLVGGGYDQRLPFA